MKKFAFTLAEVLITLSILGVVAAITIPNVVNSYKERVLVTQLKRAYSIVLNAVDIALVEHRNEDWAKKGAFQKYVSPYLNIKKDCTGKYGQSCTPVEDYQDLWPYSDKNPDFSLSCRNGNYDNNNCFYTKLILNNGMIIYARDTGLSNSIVTIDINGAKKPNRWNVDLFYFTLSKDTGLSPTDGVCDYKHHGETYCAAYVLRTGNMNYLHKKI